MTHYRVTAFHDQPSLNYWWFWLRVAIQIGSKRGINWVEFAHFFSICFRKSNKHAGEPHFLYNVQRTRYMNIRYTLTSIIMLLWYNLLWFYKRLSVLWFDNIYGVIINLKQLYTGVVLHSCTHCVLSDSLALLVT